MRISAWLLLAFCWACSSAPNRSVPTDRLGFTPQTPVEPEAPQTGSGPGADSVAEADAPTAEGASTPTADRDQPLVRVAGQVISTGDLLSAWMQKDSRNVRALLEELILSRIVKAETARLGVRLAEGDLQQAVFQVQERLAEQVRQTGSGLGVEEFIQRRLGLDPKQYLERLRTETRLDLLAERVVRAWLLSRERAEVRVIVVAEASEANALKAQLEGGADFGQLAREHSVESTGSEGGRVPPVVRGPTALAQLAFATQIGQIGGPVMEGGKWLLLKVDARPAVISGSWNEVSRQVLSTLNSQPIEDPEYWQWKADVLARYEVDMTPFLEITGEVLGR